MNIWKMGTDPKEVTYELTHDTLADQQKISQQRISRPGAGQ